MKKLILVLVASLFMFTMADAQMFKYGIKAGVGFSSLKMEDITGISDGADVYSLVTGDGVMGYHVGVQTRIKVAMLIIQPELYFNAGGGSLEQVVDNGATEVLNVKYSRIDVPLLVGVKLGPARINAGPVGSFVLGETTDLDQIQDDYTLFTNAMTWGFQAGLGIDISKISIDARYEGSLSQLGETLSIGGNDFALDARPSQWIISLGVWF
ncbi:MAG: porin family protein [Bacteroidota bacterium]